MPVYLFNNVDNVRWNGCQIKLTIDFFNDKT
jgi:hypothetical protein